MTRTQLWLSVGALAVTFGASGSLAAAQEQGSHRERVQRAAQGNVQRQEQRRAVPRSGEGGNRSVQSASEARASNPQAREARPAAAGAPRQARGASPGRSGIAQGGRDPNWNGNNRAPAYVAPRYAAPVYVAPRYVAPRYVAPAYVYPVPRAVVRAPYPHHYGSGGSFSVFFAVGSGYRYGAPYYGPVYGYSAPVYSGPHRYYGDVRLLVRPRDAAVYVDGYYAGVVDDFDGGFQRLTIEIGPHEIEIERPGFEPQVFQVYVDPTRTIDLRADLYPQR